MKHYTIVETENESQATDVLEITKTSESIAGYTTDHPLLPFVMDTLEKENPEEDYGKRYHKAIAILKDIENDMDDPMNVTIRALKRNILYYREI